VLDLNVSLDPRDLAKFRRLLTANRKIAAQSLTFTAERAQTAWRAENHRDFHMRRNWIDRGVRIRHATVSNLVAQVGSIDKFMGRHVKGVDTPKTSSGKGLFVPIEDIDKQGTHTQIRARLRRMAGTKSGPFWRHGVLLRRTGRGRDAPLTVLGVMRRSVNIEPRLDAVHLVDAAVRVGFGPVYERLLLKWAASA
jgi:hypothetical protein